MQLYTCQLKTSLDEKEVSKEQVSLGRFSLEMKKKHLKVGR